MDTAAKIITAVAALFAAVTWPIFFAAVLFAFRMEIRTLLVRMPAIFDRIKKIKIANLEADIEALANSASNSGEITPDQTRVAASLSVETLQIGTTFVFSELDKLCIQFDTVRRTLPAGSIRTHEMTRIIAKMRALSLAASGMVNVYSGSGSAGSRLAAIAMMQMDPEIADIHWLLKRFSIEVPFLFYHAALALTNVANSRHGHARDEVIEIAKAAIVVVRSFQGNPDRETLNVLDALISE